MKLQQYLNSNLKLPKLLSTQIKHILQFWLRNTNNGGVGGRQNNHQLKYFNHVYDPFEPKH